MKTDKIFAASATKCQCSYIKRILAKLKRRNQANRKRSNDMKRQLTEEEVQVGDVLTIHTHREWTHTWVYVNM